MSDSRERSDREHDKQLAQDVTQAAAEMQRAIHAAVEAGLKVTLTVEAMHHVGRHYPEPLLEVETERVIKLP